MKWEIVFRLFKTKVSNKRIKTNQQVDVRPIIIIFFAVNNYLQKCIQYLSNYIATVLSKESYKQD
jgi:hypothetical protein